MKAKATPTKNTQAPAKVRQYCVNTAKNKAARIARDAAAKQKAKEKALKRRSHGGGMRAALLGAGM